MATPSVIPSDPPRETFKQIRRVTREKRTLWYVLTVLQQPERARACGSGMKANSDRRPVDPPPVVELRIFEGPSIEKGKLITFEYNANFFLYASLESARTIAHGRVQNAAINNPPILTGVPASGMAYLDKPAEAGYFIFPDLSVRHEGTYRLSFSLFEMTKEEKDYDLEPSSSELPNGVDWRMDIETLPFSVYSAKKFPGLMESTVLSKTVAEQGCRVRIRRDVRMRKRDNKTSNMDRHDGEYSRHRTVTPAPSEDSRALRARSTSNSSEHRAPYPAEPQRRPSMVDSYPSSAASSTYDQIPPGQRSHLTFSQSMPQYAAPCPTAPHMSPMTPTNAYAPPMKSPYIKSEYRYQDGRSMAAPSPSSSQVIKSEPYERRTSISKYVPPSPSVYSSATIAAPRRESYAAHPATPIAPAPQIGTQARSHTLRSPMSIPSLISDRPIEPQPPLEARQIRKPPLLFPAPGEKRKREMVFYDASGPLHNGSRQDDGHCDNLSNPIDQCTYKRADGTSYQADFTW